MILEEQFDNHSQLLEQQHAIYQARLNHAWESELLLPQIDLNFEVYFHHHLHHHHHPIVPDP